MTAPDDHFSWALDDGTDVTIRPIRPEDAAIEQTFVQSLSTQSKYLRFFRPLKQLSPADLMRFTHNEYPDSMALIATIVEDGSEREIGVARYARAGRDGRIEFAVVVADEWQGKGVATELLRRLFGIASGAGFEAIEGLVLAENRQMLQLARQLGFSVHNDEGDQGLRHLHRTL